jgi:hypothetical protein
MELIFVMILGYPRIRIQKALLRLFSRTTTKERLEKYIFIPRITSTQLFLLYTTEFKSSQGFASTSHKCQCLFQYQLGGLFYLKNTFFQINCHVFLLH